MSLRWLCVPAALLLVACATGAEKLENASVNAQPAYNVRIDGDVYRVDLANKAAWHVSNGALAAEEKALRLSGDPAGKMTFVDFPHRRVGGNILQRFRVRLEDAKPDAEMSVVVNRFPVVRAPKEGIRVDTEDHFRWSSREGAVVHLQDTDGKVAWSPKPGKSFVVEFIHVDRYKELRIDGVKVASLAIETPWVCAEGVVELTVRNAALLLEDYDIRETWWDAPRRTWTRGEVLFEDDCAGPESAKNWVFERKYKDEAFAPVFKDGWLRAERYSVIFSKQRIDGPAIYTFDARPVPKLPDKPESITDAIMLFDVDWYGREDDFFARTHYHDGIGRTLQGYWFDFGGNGNKTTRLRKWPHRHLLRQSIRPEDQLKPEHIHKVEVVCAEGDVVFNVDGRTLLRCRDTRPYSGGHFGILGFVRELDIRNVRVYRAKATTQE